MHSHISWQGYWYAVAILLISYYLVIILLFYRAGIRNMISGKFRTNENPFKNNNSNLTVDSPTDVKNANHCTSEYSPNSKRASSIIPVLDEMKAYFLQGEKAINNKEEILSDIRKILKKYPEIQDSELKSSFQNFLILDCENSCSVALSEDDVNRLWEG